MPQVNSWKHQGIEITLSDGGHFVATITGRVTRKPSLDAIRKAIDNSKKSTFKPFTGLREEEHYDKGKGNKDALVRVTVVGITKAPRGSRTSGEHEFLLDSGATLNVYRSLYEDSEANREAIRAYRAFMAETDRIKIEREQQREKLRAKIKVHKPDSYAMSKKATDGG